MSDARLFDPGPASHGLTDRQQHALAAITAAGWIGLTSDEVGQILHASKHDPRELCAFCGAAGLEVGRALRARGLVQQRRRQAPGGDVYMVWTVAGELRKPVERDYELPAGF